MKRVEEIKEIPGDFEAAHSKEDELYEEVLLAIVKGYAYPALLAEAALSTKSLDFERACS